MAAYEWVLIVMTCLAAVGIVIMTVRVLMRPIVVLAVIAVLGWLFVGYGIFSVDTSAKDVILNEKQ